MEMLVEADLTNDFIPSDRTLGRYQMTYDTFVKWQDANGYTSFDEDVLLAYFYNISKSYKSSTLWSIYSMLKKTINHNDNIDITSYDRLLSFLKENSVGFESEKFKIFTTEEINRFLTEAPDHDYLLMKTIMVFGVAGGCRGEELTSVKMDHVMDFGTEIIVKTERSRRNCPKLFLISGEFVKIVQKYIQRRPANVPTDRFFLQYSQGECECQVIGRNRIAIVPKDIAKYLKLDDYKSYTGHSFQPPSIGKKRQRWKDAKIVEAKLQYYKNTLNSADSTKWLPETTIDDATKVEDKKRPAAVTRRTSSRRVTAPKHVKQVNVPSDPIPVPNDIIVKSEYEEMVVPVTAGDTFYGVETPTYNDTDLNLMLPATTELMKRKSRYYMGLQPDQFLHLLQIVNEKKLISDVKLMLTLRKLRLNEEFEVIADAFDLDRNVCERYYHESKHTIIDIVDGLATSSVTTTSNVINVAVPEPTIKIEKCESFFTADPIAVEEADDSTTEIDDDDEAEDDFEVNVPEESTEVDRGFLSDDMKRRTAECTVCHKFYVPRLLNAHMDSVHFNQSKLNRTICGLCWLECDTEALLKVHQKSVHGGCSYGCDICGKTFGSKRYLSVHILTRHAQVKTYLCDTCGEGFPVQYSLLDHMKRKHNEPGHPCHLCEMKFMTALSLKDHIVARHTNERPYKCEVKGCGKTFSWPSSFKSHRRVHAGNDKFECFVCLKGFSFKGNLRNHLKTIHNQIVDNQCLTTKVI